MNYSVGIDVGGTNLKMVAISAAGQVLAEIAAPQVLGRGWKQNVRAKFVQLSQAAGGWPHWVGVAAPGLAAKDHSSIVCMPGRLPGLEGMVWQRCLKISQFVPVLNDAKAALAGEVWRGAAAGAGNVILLTLGTGVGGAAMVDGRLLHGHIGRAGHLGHISLNPKGALDIVGTPGSLEDAIGDCTVRARTAGRFASTRELIHAVSRRDKQARACWLASVRALAAAIASLVNVLDPEVVVIGGGIAQAGLLLFSPLRKYLTEFEWRPGGSRARIVPARLGDRAGAFGAAWNAMDFLTASRGEIENHA